LKSSKLNLPVSLCEYRSFESNIVTITLSLNLFCISFLELLLNKLIISFIFILTWGILSNTYNTPDATLPLPNTAITSGLISSWNYVVLNSFDKYNKPLSTSFIFLYN